MILMYWELAVIRHIYSSITSSLVSMYHCLLTMEFSRRVLLTFKGEVNPLVTSPVWTMQHAEIRLHGDQNSLIGVGLVQCTRYALNSGLQALWQWIEHGALKSGIHLEFGSDAGEAKQLLRSSGKSLSFSCVPMDGTPESQTACGRERFSKGVGKNALLPPKHTL